MIKIYGKKILTSIRNDQQLIEQSDSQKIFNEKITISSGLMEHEDTSIEKTTYVNLDL